MPPRSEKVRARARENMRKRREQFPDENKLRLRVRRWAVFGGTFELFMKYWRNQDGRCGICNRELKLNSIDRKTEPQFDHCHDSLSPRGILCLYCNTKLDWYIQFKAEIEEYLSQ